MLPTTYAFLFGVMVGLSIGLIVFVIVAWL